MVWNDKNKLHFDIWVFLEGLGGFWPPPRAKNDQKCGFRPPKKLFFSIIHIKMVLNDKNKLHFDI